MNILVTGARGFVGNYLIKDLLAIGCNVVAPNSSELDVSRPSDFDKYRNMHFQAVIHLAGLLMINQHKPEDYFRVNSFGTFNVLEFCRTEKISTLIYTMTHSDVNGMDHVKSTLRPYDPQIFTTGGWEDNSIPFISSKIAAADMIEAYNRKHVIRGVILRVANIRGYGSNDTKYNSPFHQFIKKAKAGETIEVWGNPPKTKRDFIYVKDVCSAIIAAIECQSAVGYFNVGSGIGLTIDDEIKFITQVFGNGRSKIVYRRDIPEVRKISCVFNIMKTQMVLNWSPKYSYVEGLLDFKKEEAAMTSNNSGGWRD